MAIKFQSEVLSMDSECCNIAHLHCLDHHQLAVALDALLRTLMHQFLALTNASTQVVILLHGSMNICVLLSVNKCVHSCTCSGSWYLTFGTSLVLYSNHNVLYPQSLWNVHKLFSILFYSST